MEEILEEFKNVKNTHFHLSLTLSISILVFALLGISLLAFGMNYLFKFKVEKIDALVTAGLEKLDMENRLVLPSSAKKQLVSNPNSHPIYWDKDSEIWMVKSPSGTLPLNHFLILPVVEWQKIREFGFELKNGIWIAPPATRSKPPNRPENYHTNQNISHGGVPK